MNVTVWVVLGCMALALSQGDRPLAALPAAPVHVKAGEQVSNSVVSLHVIKVMDPYYDPDDYENEPQKDGAGRILPTRYSAVLLEVRNRVKEPVSFYLEPCYLLDDKDAGTPATGEARGRLEPGGHARFLAKFNPRSAFRTPKELMFQINTGPLADSPPISRSPMPREQWEKLVKAFQQEQAEKQAQFRRAYPSSDRLFSLSLAAPRAETANAAQKTTPAVKKAK